MTRPEQDAIDMFMNITGADEALAMQMLQEQGGELNQAVNAYYSERDRSNSHVSPFHDARDNFVNNDQMDADAEVSHLPLTTATRSSNPFSLFDSSYSSGFFDGRDFNRTSNHASWMSHPREVRKIPIDIKDRSNQSDVSMPMVEDITGDTSEHVSEVHGTVVIDDDDDEQQLMQPAYRDERRYHDLNSTVSGTSAPSLVSINDCNDIEEEMIKAAIDASKKEVEGHQVTDDEEALPVKGVLCGNIGSSSLSAANMEEQEKVTTSNGRQGFHQLQSETAAICLDEVVDDVKEQPPVPQPIRPLPVGMDDSTLISESLMNEQPSQCEPQNNRPQHNGDLFHSYEWGGISSQEHDEAVMLEAAIFGGVPERLNYDFSYPSQTAGQHSEYYPRIPRSPSPTLAAQRLLKEQQDDEYLAALQLDKEKAELRVAEAAAARDAALEKEKLEKEEEQRRLQEKEEFERVLSAKKASLPHEPSLDDVNAVTLLIRMPDGSRCERRFRKTDKLKSVFNFIDVEKMITPGTYRLVTPYPRRAFGEAETTTSLSQLGLSCRQEALFLELI